MKREDLEALGLEKGVIDSIMALNGRAIESHKNAAQSAQSELETVKGQLTEANTVIESFKAMKPDELKAAADDWKAKYEQAEKDYSAKLTVMDFDKDFGAALAGAKVKYSNEVKAKLDLAALKDANGKFIAERFSEQITKIKESAADLFEPDTPLPEIIKGTTPASPSETTTFVGAIQDRLKK